MSAQISVSNGGQRVILTVNGQRMGLSKDAAFALSEKLKQNALKAGSNDWGDIYRGFPDPWKRG